MVFDSCRSSAASTSSLTSFAGEDVADPVPGDRRGGAERDEQVGLAGAAVPDQAQGLPLAFTQAQVASWAITAGSTAGLAW